MNRRSFFKSMVGGIAAAAAVRTFPFRVFSFPSAPRLLSISEQYRRGILGLNRGFDWYLDEQIPFFTIPSQHVINPPYLLVEGEVLTIEAWDAQNGAMRLRIPGRSEHPFTGIVTG